jgi:hypothetical protein
MTREITNRHSFILRIWREGGSPEWKGWVQHASSGETIQIRSLAELLTFIERHKGALAPPDMEEQAQSGSSRESNLK